MHEPTTVARAAAALAKSQTDHPEAAAILSRSVSDASDVGSLPAVGGLGTILIGLICGRDLPNMDLTSESGGNATSSCLLPPASVRRLPS